MDNKILFTSDDGETTEFFIIEQTKLADVNYLLVSEDDGDDVDAFILKDVSSENDPESVYEFVEDDQEFSAVADVFAALLEDEADLI